MPMYYQIVNLGLGKVGKTYFYLKNGYGVELFEVQIESPDLHPIVVVIVANTKAMHVL
jgi:hypothetical protein